MLEGEGEVIDRNIFLDEESKTVTSQTNYGKINSVPGFKESYKYIWNHPLGNHIDEDNGKSTDNICGISSKDKNQMNEINKINK